MVEGFTDASIFGACGVGDGAGARVASVSAVLRVIAPVLALAWAAGSADGRADAAQVERNCAQMGAVYGPNAMACTLKISGEIVKGDAARVTSSILASPHHVEVANFDSPGGNPFEALLIADALNHYFVMVVAPLGPGGGTCASACALVYLTANWRSGFEVYIHRPTFPAEVFAGLAGPDAERAYDGAADRLKAELASRRVPEAIIEQMMSIPSDSVVKLPLNYPSQTPWLEEWLSSRCGKADINDMHNGARAMQCQGDIIIAQERQVQGKD